MKVFWIFSLFFIFSTFLSFSQIDYGFGIGTRLHHIRTNYEHANKPLTFGISPSLFVKKNFFFNQLTFEIVATYAYMPKSKEYKLDDNVNGIEDMLYEKHINSKVFGLLYHDIYIQALLKYNSKYVKPFIGFEPYFKFSEKYKSDDPSDLQSYSTKMDGYAVTAGCDIKITRKIYARMQYAFGLTEDYTITATDQNNMDYSWFIKNNTIEISLRYYLSKKK